jgi:hypothetical protein
LKQEGTGGRSTRVPMDIPEWVDVKISEEESEKGRSRVKDHT